MNEYRENWGGIFDYAYRIPELKWKHVFLITVYFSFMSASHWIPFFCLFLQITVMHIKTLKIQLDVMEDMKQSKLGILFLRS